MKFRKIGTANGPFGAFQDGRIYSAPGDISAEMAQLWVDGGYACWLIEAAATPVVEAATAVPVAEKADAPTVAPAVDAPRRRPRR